MSGLGVNRTWPVANGAIYIPFVAEAQVTCYQIGWINGSTVSGNIDVGIYDRTGVRQVSKGSTAMAGASAIQLANITDTTLTPGNYFLAMAVDNTTATFSRTNTGSEILRTFGLQVQTSAFALPATATFANPANSYIPVVFAALAATV